MLRNPTSGRPPRALACVLALLVLAAPSEAAIALTQSVPQFRSIIATPATSNAFAVPPTLGDTIVVLAWSYGDLGSPVIAATDSWGNAYTVAAGQYGTLPPADYWGAAILSARVVNTGAGFTVTVTTAPGKLQIEAVALEYSGLGLLDRVGTSSGLSGAPTVSTAATTRVANELVEAVVVLGLPISNYTAVTPSTPFVQRAIQLDGANHQSGAGADLIASAVGVQTATWTLTAAGGTNYWAALATFAEASPPSVRAAFSTQPSNSIVGAPLTPPAAVSLLDGMDAVVTSDSALVSVALAANPSGAILSGTTALNAVSGVAVYPNLSLDRPGAGFTLQASSGNMTVFSAPFDVSAPPDAGGQPDSGLDDGGPPDAGDLDAGIPDSGASDAGPEDAGTMDAGPADAGTDDAGPVDASTPDSGAADAGPQDAGTTDAGPAGSEPDDAGNTATGTGPTDAEASTLHYGSTSCGCSQSEAGAALLLAGLFVARRRGRRYPALSRAISPSTS